MPDLPFDPPKDAPRRDPAVVAASEHRARGAALQPSRHPRDVSVASDRPPPLSREVRAREAAQLPRNERLYGFADLTVLRQIAGELQQGTPFRAVVRTLQSSRTGQLTFDFRLDAHPARIIELKPRTPEPFGDADARHPGHHPLRHPRHPSTIGTGVFGAISSAEQYFLMGSLLDDGTPERVEEAVKSYRRALEEDPDLVAALINLANIRYSRDELAEAQALYERAISLDDSYFEAHFNLGNIHHDHGRYAEAEASYRIALALNNDYADAHFYLAVTLEKMGRSIDARAHWKAYERLAPNGEWVELAREFSD